APARSTSTLLPYTTLFRSKRIDLFRDPQRRLAYSIVRADVAHDCRINRAPGNHDRVIAHMRRIAALGETRRDDDKRIVGADKIRSEEHTSELQSLRHLVCR